jgi:Zn-finger nucleic acid-binding protein
MDLTCPKCQASMRSYERSGITVDQCNECRGIFLDRGELEKLVDAESSWQDSQPSQPPVQQAPPSYQQQERQGYQEQDYREQDYRQRDDGKHAGYPPRKKKRKNFLEELFE